MYTYKKYVIHIKICAAYRDMPPRLRLVCLEPGLRPIDMLALLQLHLHSRLKTGLQWIGQRQLQDETIHVLILGFGAAYTTGFM